jgi:hypothetical protein
MISTRSKKPLPLILVEVPKDQKKIFQLRSVCHLLIILIIPRIDDLESAVGALEDKIKSAMIDSTRIRVEPRQKEILPQWIVDLIRAKNRATRLAFRTGDALDRTEANRLGNEVKYALIDHRSDRWETKLESLATEDNSIWRMAKALRSNKKPLAPIQGANGLVFSDVDKAEAFPDSLEQQCRPNVVDADPVHIEEIENQVRLILSRHDDTPIKPASLRRSEKPSGL